MNFATRFAVPGLLLLAFPALGQPASPAAPKVIEKAAPEAAKTAPAAPGAELKTCLAIENREAKDPSSSFKVAAGTKIYAWARIVRGEAGKVTIAFRKGDQDVFTQDLSVASVPFRTNAYKTFRKGDAGDWTAVVRDASGKELALSAFKVEIE
ncbi:MAG: DUF2914 domain-containing protein [Thermoanaerobaculia bacterium]